MSRVLHPEVWRSILIVVLAAPLPASGQDALRQLLGVADAPAFVIGGPKAQTVLQIIGAVQDVAIDGANNTVHVLDRYADQIKGFSLSDGTPTVPFRRTSGGGEFRAPVRVFSHSPHLAVLNIDQRISRFVVDPSSRDPEFVSDEVFDEQIVDMCGMGSDLVVRDTYGFVIEADSSMTGRRRIVVRNPSRDPLVDRVKAEGRLGCGAGTFWFGANTSGSLTAYDVDGLVKYTIGFDWFLSVNVEVDGVDGRATVRRLPYSAVGTHSFEGLVGLPQDGLLVQVALKTPESTLRGKRFAALRSLYISPDGEAREVGTDLPLVLAISDSAVVALDDSGPFPRLAVWTRIRGGR